MSSGFDYFVAALAADPVDWRRRDATGVGAPTLCRTETAATYRSAPPLTDAD
jgi:hypothetical protein